LVPIFGIVSLFYSLERSSKKLGQPTIGVFLTHTGPWRRGRLQVNGFIEIEIEIGIEIEVPNLFDFDGDFDFGQIIIILMRLPCGVVQGY
jgi:hypothetical protein